MFRIRIHPPGWCCSTLLASAAVFASSAAWRHGRAERHKPSRR